MKEIWKDIPGYEGRYWASNLGSIRSINRVLKPSKHRDGYLKVVLCLKGVHKTYQVHRLIASAFIPNPDNLPQVNHKDECKTNNRALLFTRLSQGQETNLWGIYLEIQIIN